MEKQYTLGAVYISANHFLLRVKRASTTHQVSGGNTDTAENEETSCTEHTEAGLDFAKGLSQAVLPVHKF